MHMSQLMTSSEWCTFWEIQNSNVKFVKKKLLIVGSFSFATFGRACIQTNVYKCPTCDKSYTESHNLKKHRQKEHGL